MLKRSQKQFPDIAVNTPVQIAIPKEDRSSISDRNLLGVVLARNDSGAYTVGTELGTLQRLIARPSLKVLSSQIIKACDVPQKKITVRGNAAKCNLFGGKGMVRCNCHTKCQTNVCSCKKNNRFCTSNCHKSTQCFNKT